MNTEKLQPKDVFDPRIDLFGAYRATFVQETPSYGSRTSDGWAALHDQLTPTDVAAHLAT